MYIQEISERYTNDGYSTDRSPGSVLVRSDKDDVDITNQIGWEIERQQVIIYNTCFMFFKCNVISLNIQEKKLLEDINNNDEVPFVVAPNHGTTTTFVVFSSKTSPPDLRLSLIINGRKSVPFERKASRRCACQIFCCREGLNCWRTNIAFFPEHLLYVSTCTCNNNTK